MANTISLSIFMLRLGKESEFDRGVGDDRTSRLPLVAPFEGYFSPLPADVRRPAWATQVGSLLAPPGTIALQSQSPAGFLVVRRASRTFVITFGHAWMRLQDSWLERDFGRRVTLNLMRADSSIIELRTEQIFARWHLASERAPRGSSVDSFGVEFDRDLVSVVEGISSNALFGKSIRGGTSLRVQADLGDLLDLLDQAEAQFKSTAYQKRWPYIDNLSPVVDSATIAALERQLDGDLAAGKGKTRVILFTPAQRRGEPLTVSSYVFGRMQKNAALAPYLTFGSWENHTKKGGTPLSVSAAKATPIHLLDDDRQELGVATVYECFGYEASLRQKPFILTSGVWYEVVPSFLKRINQTVGQIPAPSIALPPWNQTDHEDAYNEDCAKADQSLLHFDTKTVWYGGGQSRFEFCDLMHLQSRRLYFVKVPSRSSGMSHLFEQTRRTAELFFSPDPGFRAALRKKIRKLDPAADTSWTTSRPRRDEWKLCLVSMGRSVSKLPFFARCSLANAYNDLRASGHEVEFLAV